MAIQTPNKISKVTILNKTGFGDTSDFRSRSLEDGEIAIVKETISGTRFETKGIILGPGKIGDLIDDDKQYVHCEVGAGYKLPSASYDTLGGIKLDNSYWHNVEGGLIPSWFTLSGSTADGYQLLSFSNKVKIQADWIATERTTMQSAVITTTNNKYFEINADFGKIYQAFNTCVEDGQLVYIGYIDVNDFIDGIWNNRDGSAVSGITTSYNSTTNRTTVYSEDFVFGNTYVANVDYIVDETAPTALASSTDYAGIKICNWNANDSNQYAFLGTNNTGELFYSSDGSNYRRVAYVPNTTGVVYTGSGVSSNLTTKTLSSFNLKWDSDSDGNLRTFYYNPIDGNTTNINLGTIVHAIKTDDSSAVVITDHSIKGDVSQDGYISVNHAAAPTITESSGTATAIGPDSAVGLNCITNIGTDDWGHLNSITITHFEFNRWINQTVTNTNNIATLQTEVGNLATTSTVEALTNRVITTETNITNLQNNKANSNDLDNLYEQVTLDIANVQDSSATKAELNTTKTELEQKVTDLQSQFMTLSANFNDLLERFVALDERVKALELTDNNDETTE